MSRVRLCATAAAAAAIFSCLSARPAAAQCLGDCNGNGQVASDEVARGVEIALLEQPIGFCEAFLSVPTVDRLVTAVANPICPATPTTVPTATHAPTVPATPSPVFTATQVPTIPATATNVPSPTSTATVGPTNTPGAASNAVAGGAAVVAKSLSAIPSLVSAIVTGLLEGTPPEPDQGGAAGMCPLGGQATRVCTDVEGGAVLDLGLAACAIETPDGSLVMTTPVPISLGTFGMCPSGINFLNPRINATANVRGRYFDDQGGLLLDTSAVLASTVDPQFLPAPSCAISGATLGVTGLISSVIPGGGGAASTNFLQTGVVLTNLVFRNPPTDCLLVRYELLFNGNAQVRDVTTNQFADVVFDDLVVRVDSTASPTTIEIDGGLSFDCIDGAITLETVTPLVSIPGRLCPTGGEIDVISTEGPSTVVYRDDGMVQVDADGDGTVDSTFDSCSDPLLQLCPE